MNGVSMFMEKHFVPIAAKIGGEKHLVALRDAFIAALPATMAGSVAVMINALIRDLPSQFIEGYNVQEIPVLGDIVRINGFMWNGTLAVVGIIFAFSWGYHLAKAYKVNPFAGGLVSLAALLQGVAFSFNSGEVAVTLPQSAVDAINEAGGGFTATTESLQAAGWGWLRLANLDGNAYFTVMVLGGLATWIYCQLMLKNITIKLPGTVPPAVANAFIAIIPATVALYVTAAVYYVFSQTIGATTGLTVIDWVRQTIAEPFMALTQGLGSILLITFLVSLLWFFGLHGTNILGPVMSSIWGQAQLINVNVFETGFEGYTGVDAVRAAIPSGQAFAWVSGSFDAFAWFGGAGGTLVLILLILVLSKRDDYRTVAKLSVAPGLFNINEPVMFGLPIVMNPMFLIPFVLAPMVGVTIGFFATQMGWVNPVTQPVLWVLPPFLMSFLATAGDWRAPIVTLVSFLAGAAIWAPFVLAANAQVAKEDQNLSVYGNPDEEEKLVENV